MKRPLVLVLLAMAALASPMRAGAEPATLLPLVEGPDVPPWRSPALVLGVFDEERFDGCAGKVTAVRRIHAPEGEWDRIVMVFTGTPVGDPWDRLFTVSIGGAEVLRGTTPRTTFTVRRDITEYGALLPPGELVDVALSFGTYVGEQLGSVDLEFYADEPTAPLVRARRERVIPALNGAALTGNLKRVGAEVDFGEVAPARATIDLTLSNHAAEEGQFWSRFFRVYVDGVDLGVARAMPYRYAFLGTGASNANAACTGPATSDVGDAAHPLMWWTAQRVANQAGLHTGVGEIPPFRAEVDPAYLPLLSGARTVEVGQIGGTQVWITSLSFLVDA